MKTKLVTTMGPGGWTTYGERMVKSVREFWPSMDLVVWVHDAELPSFEGVTFRSLNEVEAFKNVKAALGGASDQMGLQYCFKAIALANTVSPDMDWIAFIDADVEFMRPVDGPLEGELFDPNFDLTYLYRKGIKESEGSWFAFNLQTTSGASLLADFYGMYVSLEFQHLKKQHDNAVLDRIVVLHQAHGLRVKNLAPGALGLDAFHQSMLGAYAIHYKGPQKNVIADPGLGAPGRYNALCDMLKHSCKVLGKAHVVEVGTWNGSRAVQMAEAAFGAGMTEVKYVGFDTFEGGNDRVHEGHTKPHATEWIVRQRLENYAKMRERQGHKFEFELVKGNTLETMPTAGPLLYGATFAYVDGGHSYETTKSDYEHVEHVPFVVFDDVIAKPEPGAPEGPIKVWQECKGNKVLHQTNDGYGGLKQTIAFGVVTREGMSLPQVRQQLVVKPTDSVDKSEQFEHIKTNTALTKKWLMTCQAHSRLALLVSAGPSLPEFAAEIRRKQRAGAVVFAVKHALPELLKHRIRPDFTVLLDPRPVDGKSTHGIMRTELFKDVKPTDKFLMATMTHPSVREVLDKKGAQVIGWHAHTQATQAAKLPEFQIGTVVGGGTCAATRMPMLAFLLGFRRLDFYGYDFHYPADTDPTTLKQALMKIALGTGDTAKEFVTTGELVAAIQDMGNIVKWLAENRLSVRWFGDGAGPTVWQQTIQNYVSPGEYTWTR